MRASNCRAAVLKKKRVTPTKITPLLRAPPNRGQKSHRPASGSPSKKCLLILRIEVLEGLEEAHDSDGAGELVDGRQRARLAPQGVHLVRGRVRVRARVR